MDTIELKPAVFSILIGINNQRHGVPLEQFEPVYDALLTEAKTANPKLRVVLCEPFTLPVGKRKENCEPWRAGVQAIQDAVAQFATRHGAALVRFRPSRVAKLKKPTGSGGATIFNLHDGGIAIPVGLLRKAAKREAREGQRLVISPELQQSHSPQPPPQPHVSLKRCPLSRNLRRLNSAR